MQEQDPVKALIKTVGRGKTLSRDLTREQAQEAMERLLRGEFTSAQMGAFLQAMRIKETCVAELVGAAEGAGKFRQRQFAPQPAPASFPLVVNLAFDTARKGGVLSLAALAYLKQAGLAQPLVIWEPATLFQQQGAMEKTVDVLRNHAALGACLPEMVAVRELCEPWGKLSWIRKELGFRSILNTVEKLLRPWETAPVVVGISHDTFSERLCHVLFALGAPRGAVVRGHHGTCDLGFGEKPTEFNFWHGSDVAEGSIAPDLFPWESKASVLLASSFDEWGVWIEDEGSALWAMIRSQSAFFLSIATGKSLQESVATIQSIRKDNNHA